MKNQKLTYQRLKSNLTEIEQAVKAIQDGQVDAIVSTKNIILLRLKEAEDALRQSEQRYRNLLEQNPDPVFCVDTQGRFTEVNEAACRFTGYSLEELLEKKWQDLCDPEDLKKTMQHFKAALQGESPDFEVSTIGKDGRKSYFYLTGGPLTVRDEIQGLFIIAHDLTELKKTEKALRESEQKLALATSGTQIGIFDRNIITGEIIATEQNVRLLGLRTTTTTTTTTTLSQHYQYRDWAKRIHPEDLMQVEAQMDRCMNEHTPFESEYRVVWPDGSEHWIATRAIFQYDDESKPQRMLGILMDITENKRTEETLHQALAKAEKGDRLLAALMEYVPEGVTIADAPDVRIRMVSRAGQALTGKEYGDLVGIPVTQHINRWDIYRADGVTQASNDELPLTRATQEGETIRDEIWVLGRPDGQRIPLLCSAGPIRNKAGNITGGIIVWRDITKLKMAEERISRLNENLEEKIKKRTAELTKAISTLRSQAELLDLAHDTIIVHDLDGKITFWNHGAEKTYGWKRQEVMGKVTHEVLKTKFSEPLLKIISAVSTRGNWEGELIHTAKNKKQIIVESRWALQKDENGKPSAVLEIERDITKRKSAEKKTQEARRYAESIIATIQEALIVLDSKLRVLKANNAFYKLFSLKPEDTEGEFIYRVGQNQWDIPELKKLLEDVLPKNTSFEEYEMEYASKKESGKTLLLNARRIYQDKKKTEMILLAIQDITTRKQQEKRIGELTEELLLAEEEQRQEVAIASHDSIGQMLAFSKRELASLLKEPNLTTNKSLKKVLNSISKALKQSRELTTDLSSPTLHTFGLEAGLEELVEQFSDENGLKYEFNTTEKPKDLDKKVQLLLYRCVKELLCNIAKHSRAKNIAVDVKTINNFLELTVTDDGKGFNVDRLNNNNKKKKTFGLFSIQQRLTNVGGSFNIESEKKKGTKIILRAPLSTTKNEKGK